MKDLRINEDHLDQIEHLLAQSLNGIHLLFDNETIARILKTPMEEKDLFQMRNLEKIQGLFTELLRQENFYAKRAYLYSLDPESFELMLRTYFHIVDNSLFAADSERH